MQSGVWFQGLTWSARRRPPALTPWRLTVTAVLVTVVLVSGNTQRAHAADTCLPATRASCQPDITPMALSEPRRLSLPAAEPAPIRPPARTQKPAQPQALTLRTKHRIQPLRRLDQQLLLREIDTVRRLLRQTPEHTAEHARTLRRLAESYVELAESAARRYAHSMRLVRAVSTLNPPRAQLYRKRASQAASRERRSRWRAVRLYRQLLKKHPHYCRFAGHFDPRRRSCSDEVLRYLAHELEQLHEPASALQSYRQLLRDWPGSPHTPIAALAVAETTFDAARRDHGRWPEAQQAYRTALRYPLRDRRLRGYMAYKLGHAHWSVGQYQQALDGLARSIRMLAAQAEKAPGTPRNRNELQARALLEASRRDLVTVYGLSGDPAKAAAFFAPLSGDPPGASTRTQAMVLSLGKAMLRTGQLDAAAQLYQHLASQTHDRAARCSYQAVVSRAHSATRPHEPKATVDALAELHTTIAQAQAAGDTQAARHCRNLMLEVGSETALGWHTETLGTVHAPGTGRPETMAAALRVFGWLTPLKHGRSELHYAHGEMLLADQHHGECADAFAAAFKAAPQGARGADAALAASRCWLLQQPDNSKLGPEHMAMGTPKQVGQEALTRLRMYEQVSCRIQPPAQHGPAATEHAAIANLRTHIYLDQGRLNAATATQRDLALHAADSLAGMHAARAYLRGMERLQQQEQLPQCTAMVKQDSVALRARHCGNASANTGSLSERKMRAQLCRTLSAMNR